MGMKKAPNMAFGAFLLAAELGFEKGKQALYYWVFSTSLQIRVKFFYGKIVTFLSCQGFQYFQNPQITVSVKSTSATV